MAPLKRGILIVITFNLCTGIELEKFMEWTLWKDFDLDWTLWPMQKNNVKDGIIVNSSYSIFIWKGLNFPNFIKARIKLIFSTFSC